MNVPFGEFIWGIKRVSCLQGLVALIGLFPEKDIVNVAYVASIHNEMSVTKHKASGNTWCFVRRFKLVNIKFYLSTTNDSHAVVSPELIVSHRIRYLNSQ